MDDGGGKGGEASSNDIHHDTKQSQPNSHWENAPNRECYSSFGDSGTTATVNAYGNIMQISKYIGKGRSGMFSADHKCVSEPYSVVKRTTDLQSLIDKPVYKEDETYGAHFPGLDFSFFESELTFVHNRWPRIDHVLRHDWRDVFPKRGERYDSNIDYVRSDLSPFSRFSTTWMVYEGIVFQHCVVKNNSARESLPIEIEFAENMLIRDLDHLDPYYSFKEEEDDDYFTFLGPRQHSWVRLHHIHRPQDRPNLGEQSNEELMTDSVAVIVSVYINNQVQSWSRTATDLITDDPTDNITDDAEILDHSDTPNDNSNAHGRPEERKTNWAHILEPREEVEVTFAYQMYYTQDSQRNMGNSFGHVDKSLIESVQKTLGGEPIEGTFSLVSLLPVIEEMIIPHWMFHAENEPEESASSQLNNIEGRYTSRLEDPSGEISSMSPLNHLEFFARRNLEHILSVCAIPVHSDDEKLGGLEGLGARPVALTCGDMAFHRVNTGASFFAFEFLIETARRLQQPTISTHEQAKSLLDRIQQVCIGHLLWLILIAEKDRQFAANYWVSGNRMDAMHTKSWYRNSWQPKDSPTDSAYQWIKVQECLDVFGEVLGKHKKAISNFLQPTATAWRLQLKCLDAKADCAWPHAREDGINVFRLDDHIWIWRGLKAIEYIEDPPQKTEDTFNAWMNQTKQRTRRQNGHDSKNVQQKVIRHFTTKNEFSAKKTLAVTRSSRETRFLFHSRDTVLLYAIEWDFISAGDSNALEVWQNAMRAQPEHEENQRSTWERTLHHALSILMALKGFSINKRSSSDIIKDSFATLTRSSSPNGLFAGLLDKTTNKPDMFHQEDDRDSYFHAGFEISFILFRNAHEIIDSWNPKTGPSQKRYETDQEMLARAIENVGPSVTQHTLKRSLVSNMTHLLDNASTQSQRFSQSTSTMKKTMPANRFIDADNVVEVDDEWLYNHPGFLASEVTAALSFDEAVWDLRSRKRRDDPVSRETPEETKWLDRISEKSRETTDLNRSPTKKAAAVFEIGRKSRTEKDGATKDDPPMLDVVDLWTRLRNPRDPQSSKKRFVWLRSSEEDIALRCYLASHNEEKSAIFKFFGRNFKAENFFHDETTMILNTWETELHLSFYQLSSTDDSTSNSKGTSRANRFTFPRDVGHVITKASIGFRFSGDFFDRFWTCHLIEMTSEKHPRWDLWLKDPSYKHRMLKHKAWGQRKVLELHLFERILIALVDSTKDLFWTLKKAVNLEGCGREIFYMNHMNDNYSEFGGDWEDLQESLKHISDDLERIDSTIVKWQTREIDRGAERPRWTRNDETNYRGDINKLMVSTYHKVQEFRRLRAEISSFREWLMRCQEQIRRNRDETAFRDSANIKYFTYVTVVFLPLGFATSVFSMSEVPEQDLVRKMATIAIVALMITVLAIKIAQNVKFGFDQAIEDRVRQVRNNSILFKLDEQPVGTQKATNGESTQSSNVKEEALADEAVPNPSSLSGEIDVARSTDTGRQGHSQRHRSASNITIWLWYILTELPAQIVMSAYTRMINECISVTTVFNVVIGIIVLPWCLVALVARVIAVNLADLIHIISSLVFDTFEKIFNSTERSPGPLEFLLKPSDRLRFFKATRDKGSNEPKREAD